MIRLSKPAIDRAMAALQTMLNKVSAVTITNIRRNSHFAEGNTPGCDFDILAHVEVFGRVHTLACQVCAGEEPEFIDAILENLQKRASSIPGQVTAVLICPVLTPEVQALCAQHQIGCLDLCGNGRLTIGEVFMSMRSLPPRAFRRRAPASSRHPVLSSVGEESASHDFAHSFTPLGAGSARRTART